MIASFRWPLTAGDAFRHAGYLAVNTVPAVDRFITELAAISLPRAFNPWSEVDAENDLGVDASAIRRDHLRRYLAERVDHARLLLIAEAAGYQGCKFSGIAMTSERQLMASPSTGSEFFEGAKRRTSRAPVRPAGFTEPTATIVWGKMLEAGLQGREWVNWNTFAWHPQGATPLSNRTPTPEELEAGVPALQTLPCALPGGAGHCRRGEGSAGSSRNSASPWSPPSAIRRTAAPPSSGMAYRACFQSPP